MMKLVGNDEDTRVESKCEYDTRFEWCYTLRNPILRKWN